VKEREAIKKRILVICKDTGAANAISAFLRDFKDSAILFRIVCIGYAVEVFKRNGVAANEEYAQDPERRHVIDILDGFSPDLILLGTSFDSWAERWCCVEARKRDIYTLSFLDWWSNFAVRFSTPKEKDLAYLPDGIATIDDDACAGCMADGIPERLLHRVGNPYWDYLTNEKDNILALRLSARKKIGVGAGDVFVMIASSHIKKLDIGLGYDEKDFWRSIVPLPAMTKRGAPVLWGLRPHPRDDDGQIKDILKQHCADPLMMSGLTIQESIASADYVVGMCSSVLLEAALIGKKIASLQPGLRPKGAQYLKIFDHLKAPKITDPGKVRNVVKELINDELPAPDLTRLPFYVGGRKAHNALSDLLSSVLKVPMLQYPGKG
jgi:hypothetical protein